MARLQPSRIFEIRAEWDAEAGVWWCSNDELPLTTEAPTFEQLVSRVLEIAPEIAAENGLAALKLPHRSSPWAEGPLRCPSLYHGPGPHWTPEYKSIGSMFRALVSLPRIIPGNVTVD